VVATWHTARADEAISHLNKAQNDPRQQRNHEVESMPNGSAIRAIHAP
jgi:hypothetical protein